MSQPADSGATRVVALRDQARTARREISSDAQSKARVAVATRIRTLPELASLRACSVVACFVAFDGEIDLTETRDDLVAAGFSIALPRIDGASMSFHEVRETELAPGQFGILEPPSTAPVVDHLDLALVPLAAFDQHCHRIGMGRGYYDRYFTDPKVRPPLIGVAHDEQEVELIPVRPWDITLDAVVTPTRTLRPTPNPVQPVL